MSFYLIENETGFAIWCGEQAPIQSENSVKCSDETYLCFNAQNSTVFEFEKMADFKQGKYIFNGESIVINSAWVEPVNVSLLQVKSKLTAAIDDHIAKIYERFTRFNVEYVEREAAARAYRAADYTGDVSTLISSFSTPTGMSARAATDLIIAQSDNLKTALISLSSLRMEKYYIITATTEEACNTKYQQIINQANTIAQGL